MKKYFLLASFLPLFTQAQKIVENRIDDFTHDSVKVTSWDPLVWNFGPNMKMRTRVSAVGEKWFLNVTLMRPGPDMEMTEGLVCKRRPRPGAVLPCQRGRHASSGSTSGDKGQDRSGRRLLGA